MAKKPKKELVSVENQELVAGATQNARALEHLIAIRTIPKPNINDAQQVANACENYLLLCHQNDQKPLVSGLAIVLGITRKRLLDILQGKERSEARDVIEEYFSVLEAYDELALKEGKVNSIAGIFLAKNNYGYTDGVKIEVVHSEETNEEIAEKYRDRAKILKGEEVEVNKKNDD